MRRRVAYARDYGDHIMGKFKFPTAYTILFVLIALVAAMTWIVPAGKYQMVTNAALG